MSARLSWSCLLAVLITAACQTFAAAGEARLYFSRRGPTTDGCPGPTVGEVPQFKSTVGGEASLHLWLNVDNLGPAESLSQISWSVRASGAYVGLVEHEISNPVNPLTELPRWAVTRAEAPSYPTIVDHALAFSIGGLSSSIGTRNSSVQDPLYDPESKSFHLAELTVRFQTFGVTGLYLRNGLKTFLASGNSLGLFHGNSTTSHDASAENAGDAVTLNHVNADAILTSLGAPGPDAIGVGILDAAAVDPRTIERRIDLSTLQSNAFFCGSGVEYSRVAVENYHRPNIEVYVDFADFDKDDIPFLFEVFAPYPQGPETFDVSGSFPLGNGVDYDLKLILGETPASGRFVIGFDTFPIANVGVVPEPSTGMLAFISAVCIFLLRRPTAIVPEMLKSRRPIGN